MRQRTINVTGAYPKAGVTASTSFTVAPASVICTSLFCLQQQFVTVPQGRIFVGFVCDANMRILLWDTDSSLLSCWVVTIVVFHYSLG